MTSTLANQTHIELSGDREIVFSRHFGFPRELVFSTHTTAEHLKQWWAPEHFTVPYCTLDFRPGGTWLYCFRSPEGEEYWGNAVYEAIDPPSRIVYVDSFADADGNATGEPMITEVTFEAANGGTDVTTRITCVSAEARASLIATGVQEGLGQSFDHLDAYLLTIA